MTIHKACSKFYAAGVQRDKPSPLHPGIVTFCGDAGDIGHADPIRHMQDLRDQSANDL